MGALNRPATKRAIEKKSTPSQKGYGRAMPPFSYDELKEETRPMPSNTNATRFITKPSPKRAYHMNGKPVADIDEVMSRVEGRGQSSRGDEPVKEGGGTYPKSNVRVKIKGGSDPNQTFPSSITGETTPERRKKPEGNDSGGGSATEDMNVRVKGGEGRIKAKIKGGKRRAGGRY